MATPIEDIIETKIKAALADLGGPPGAIELIEQNLIVPGESVPLPYFNFWLMDDRLTEARGEWDLWQLSVGLNLCCSTGGAGTKRFPTTKALVLSALRTIAPDADTDFTIQFPEEWDYYRDPGRSPRFQGIAGVMRVIRKVAGGQHAAG